MAGDMDDKQVGNVLNAGHIRIMIYIGTSEYVH